MCILAALAGKAWPLNLAVGDLQQPQSPALLQEGSRLAGEADVPTAPGMTRVCAAAAAPAPIWAPAVLAQLRPESGTQETWVTSGTGRSRDSHMASQVLTVVFPPCSRDSLTSCLHHS